jgi:hypothetical protein
VDSLELFNYFKSCAIKYGAYEYVRLKHRVSKATWDSVKGQWQVKVEDLSTGQTKVDCAEVLVNATGFLKYAFSLYSRLYGILTWILATGNGLISQSWNLSKAI